MGKGETILLFFHGNDGMLHRKGMGKNTRQQYALHEYFSIDMPYNRKVMKACGLDRLPDRRTFDRRFKVISVDIRSRMDAMGMPFVKDGLADPAIISVDGSLLKAKGHAWHKSGMGKNEVPRSGIDSDAKWGFSRTKGWMFGYKLHLHVAQVH